MKEKIVGVLCFPYDDKYVVQITRQLDRFHMPRHRLYMSDYGDFKKVKSLLSRFLSLNIGLQTNIVISRITKYQDERKTDESKPESETPVVDGTV